MTKVDTREEFYEEVRKVTYSEVTQIAHRIVQGSTAFKFTALTGDPLDPVTEAAWKVLLKGAIEAVTLLQQAGAHVELH